MKKYSSYIDLKLAANPKQGLKSPKNNAASCFKKLIAMDIPLTPVYK